MIAFHSSCRDDKSAKAIFLSKSAQATLNPSDTLTKLLRAYSSQKTPIEVSFREMVPWMPYNSPRYTHQLHTYPAKVIPQIPHFFLSCPEVATGNGTVLDPFGGSGTVALEACLLGHDAMVSDSNPLARLIAQVKLTPISPDHMGKRILQVRDAIKKCRNSAPPDVVNLQYWYSERTIRHLSRVRHVVLNLPDSPFSRLCKVALSSVARKLSLADPRIAVPVRLKPDRYSDDHPLHKKSKDLLIQLNEVDVIDFYLNTLKNYAHQVSSLWPIRRDLGQLLTVFVNTIGKSRKSLSLHPCDSVDLIVTSPPYLGAQKYIRSSSLGIGWLGLAESNKLRRLEDNSIGREHFSQNRYHNAPESILSEADDLIQTVYLSNPLRAHIAATYLAEMKQALENCYRLLKSGGSLVLVSGCNMICGNVFNTTKYLKSTCEDIGFSTSLEVTDTIKSRGLMTRRNKTAGMIPLESVILLKK
jgi:DNA modification methylase